MVYLHPDDQHTLRHLCRRRYPHPHHPGIGCTLPWGRVPPRAGPASPRDWPNPTPRPAGPATPSPQGRSPPTPRERQKCKQTLTAFSYFFSFLVLSLSLHTVPAIATTSTPTNGMKDITYKYLQWLEGGRVTQVISLSM